MVFRMKEARFVSQNKEKWGKMENVNHLDTDTLASNYVILSDFCLPDQYLRAGAIGKKGNSFLLGAGVSAVALSREADVVVCFSFSSVCGIDRGLLHGERRYFRALDSG